MADLNKLRAADFITSHIAGLQAGKRVDASTFTAHGIKESLAQEILSDLVRNSAGVKNKTLGGSKMVERTNASMTNCAFSAKRSYIWEAKYQLADGKDSYELDRYKADLTKEAAAAKAVVPEIKAVQDTQTATKGPETVPVILEKRLRQYFDLTGVHRLASQVSMISNVHNLAQVSAGSDVSLVAESTSGNTVTIPLSDVTFSRAVLSAKKLANRILVSSEAYEDIGTTGGFPEAILRDVSHKFSRAIDESLLVGGPLNSDGISGNASVANTPVASVAGLVLSDITTSLTAYGERSSSDPVIVVHPKVYFGPIADLLVQAGIQQQVHDGKHYLFGHEVVLSSVMAGPSASTSGDCLLIAGHLDAGCVVGTRTAVSVRESRDNAEALNDRITLVQSWRGDAIVADPSCLSKITLA